MFINSLKTGFLMFALVALFTAIGGAFGNREGALFGLLIAGGMAFYSYWFSDKTVIKAYRGQEVNNSNNPKLYKIVQKLAENANLPMPKVYIIPEKQPNAFATGRNPKNAAVACTNGLLELMNDEELAGVLAHELGHVKHRDILIGTIAATFAGAIANISRFLPYASRRNNRNRNGNVGLSILFALLGPIAASIIQMSISRRREFMADRAGAEISGNPLYLRNALDKLESYSHQIPMNNTSKPATAHMFIVNPFSNLRGLQNLFRTHPSTLDRIRELEKMAREKGLL